MDKRKEFWPIGARYGSSMLNSIAFNFPSVRLFIEEQTITVRCRWLFFKREFELRRNEITGFEIGGIIWRYVRIKHVAPLVPRYLALLGNAEKLHKELDHWWKS